MPGIQPASTADRTRSLARKVASHHAIKPDFKTSDALVDIGLSSLDLVNLMIAVEAEFDIMIPPALLSPKNFYSIDTIARMVETVRSGQAA
ncbi:phosphopantetheine-binding protein [Enterovirga sp.]|uniref:phosphopantetheine-binding protein n=1 Tax=Enterovirga sp. TaxID=2026350 RepID=UPI002C6B4B51|nr:phosphopantetheine-binding protein [Enterovirga sp.]HMO28523.1 phosphopantetheine-binding protein [Enterovirga sp.]